MSISNPRQHSFNPDDYHMPPTAKRRIDPATIQTESAHEASRQPASALAAAEAPSDGAVGALQQRVAELEEERSRLLHCCCSMATLYAEMSRTQAEMARTHADMACSGAAVARAHADMAERAAPLLERLLGDPSPPPPAHPPRPDSAADVFSPQRPG